MFSLVPWKRERKSSALAQVDPFRLIGEEFENLWFEGDDLTGSTKLIKLVIQLTRAKHVDHERPPAEETKR